MSHIPKVNFGKFVLRKSRALLLLILFLQLPQALSANSFFVNTPFYKIGVRLSLQDDREQKRKVAKQAVSEGDNLTIQRSEESLKQALLKYEAALSLWKEIDDKQGQSETLNKIAVSWIILLIP